MKFIIGSDHFGKDFAKKLQDIFSNGEFIEAFTESEQKKHIADSEVFFGFPSKSLLENGKKLKWIACPGTGIDKIVKNLSLIGENITITNAPFAHVTPMAEHVVGMMISLAHSYKKLFDDQKNKKWDVDQWESKIVELKGSNVCIFGYGALGRSIGEKLSAFDMNIYAIDPKTEQIKGKEISISPVNNLNQILAKCNWLIIAAPFIKETDDYIKKENLLFMKKGSYIIIISRGGIVNENDMSELLNSKHLAGAGIDATKIEPLPQNSPLWDIDNAIISQHASALSPEMYEERRKIFINNVKRYLNEQNLLYVCDPKKGY